MKLNRKNNDVLLLKKREKMNKKIKKLSNLPLHKRHELYIELFLDYYENFLTVNEFKDHYDIEKNIAINIIDAGRLALSLKNQIDNRCKKCKYNVIEKDDNFCVKYTNWCNKVDFKECAKKPLF